MKTQKYTVGLLDLLTNSTIESGFNADRTYAGRDIMTDSHDNLLMIMVVLDTQPESSYYAEERP